MKSLGQLGKPTTKIKMIITIRTRRTGFIGHIVNI